MNAYYLGENDQPRSSWVLYELAKPVERRANKSDLPNAIRRFFGPQPDGEMRMKPQYLSALCSSCGRYTEEAVFRIGFSDPICIRIKGDFSHTQDRVFAVSDRCLQALKKGHVTGFETKPLGSTGWHALLVTKLVDHPEGVLTPAEPRCPVCRLPDGAIGSFQHVEQLGIPVDSNTFFSPKTNWRRRLWDRDIFVGQGVVDALKAAGVTGGYCNRLWTVEETLIAREKASQGKKWKPAKATVFLNGR